MNRIFCHVLTALITKCSYVELQMRRKKSQMSQYKEYQVVHTLFFLNIDICSVRLSEGTC